MIKDIFIGCMPFGFTEGDVRRECEPYGRVESIEFHQDLENATFDSYAHVRIHTDDVDRLLNELDGKRIRNRLLRVNEVVTRGNDHRQGFAHPQPKQPMTSHKPLSCV